MHRIEWPLSRAVYYINGHRSVPRPTDGRSPSPPPEDDAPGGGRHVLRCRRRTALPPPTTTTATPRLWEGEPFLSRRVRRSRRSHDVCFIRRIRHTEYARPQINIIASPMHDRNNFTNISNITRPKRLILYVLSMFRMFSIEVSIGTIYSRLACHDRRKRIRTEY